MSKLLYSCSFFINKKKNKVRNDENVIVNVSNLHVILIKCLNRCFINRIKDKFNVLHNFARVTIHLFNCSSNICVRMSYHDSIGLHGSCTI